MRRVGPYILSHSTLGHCFPHLGFNGKLHCGERHIRRQPQYPSTRGTASHRTPPPPACRLHRSALTVAIPPTMSPQMSLLAPSLTISAATQTTNLIALPPNTNMSLPSPNLMQPTVHPVSPTALYTLLPTHEYLAFGKTARHSFVSNVNYTPWCMAAQISVLQAICTYYLVSKTSPLCLARLLPLARPLWMTAAPSKAISH
jgi:hypothetical protein